MKRTAIMFMASLAVAVLLGGLAHGDPLDDAVPAVPAVPALPALPGAGGLVATVAETLAGVGLPLETPALPALPALPAVPDAGALVATVQQTLADNGLSLPTQDPVMAVPENILVGNANEAVDRLPLYLSAVPGVTEVVTAAEETVAGLGLPLDVPALPALPVDPTSLVATVQETVAGLGLPLGSLPVGSLLPDL